METAMVQHEDDDKAPDLHALMLTAYDLTILHQFLSEHLGHAHPFYQRVINRVLKHIEEDSDD